MNRWKAARNKALQGPIPSEDPELVNVVVALSTDSMNHTDFQMVLNSSIFLRAMAIVHGFLITRRKSLQRKGGKVASVEAMWQLGFILGYLSAQHQWFPRLAELPTFKSQVEADIARSRPAEQPEERPITIGELAKKVDTALNEYSAEISEIMHESRLDEEDYAGAQEESIRRQFGDQDESKPES